MKHLVLICCCCLLAGAAGAQQLVGIKGGYSFNRMQFNEIRNLEPPQQEWLRGLAGGVVFRTLSSRHLGLQLELLLEQKGYSLFPATDQAYRIEEQHITLPIQSVVMAGRGRFQLVFSAGAFASYILSESITANGADHSYLIKFRNQPLQDWQYGLLGGMGPAYRIGRNWLQLDGRFAFTMSNRLEPNLARSDAFSISRQMSVTISLLWLTQLGRLK